MSAAYLGDSPNCARDTDRQATGISLRIEDQLAEPISLPQDQSARPSPKPTATDEEPMCDVLSQAEFGTELTEVLLKTIPTLTGAQILEVRMEMLAFAKKHGWVDG